MKKLSLIIVALLFLISFIAAEPIASTGNTETVRNTLDTRQLTAVPDKTDVLSAAPEKNIFKGTVSKINFNLKTDYQDDEAGVIYRNELGIKASQTLANEWRASAYIRFIKPINNESSNVEIKFNQAKFEYVGQFFRVILGRADLTSTLSTMNYFGPYCTAGQRYLDLVGFTVPLFLKAGIPDIEEITLPPLSVSLYYFPAMLSKAYTTYYDRREEYFLCQLRINSKISDDTSVNFIGNIGKGTTEYFTYSILSGNVTYDLNLSVDIFKHARINGSFGTLNTAVFDKTTVMSGGFEVYNLAETLIVIDSLIAEIQIPFGKVANEFEPDTGVIFVMLKKSIDRFRYFAGITNSGNDYTLKAIKSREATQTSSFGEGNIYTPENLIFNNSYGNYMSFYIGVGYEF